MKLLASLGITLVLSISLFAQERSVTADISFPGLIKPLTKNLPLPEYPEISNTAGFGGRITVGVTLDEKGNVISTDDAEGPYPICRSVTDIKVTSLRNAAQQAAAAAQFVLPDQMSGNTKGLVIYTFVSDHTASGVSAVAMTGVGNAETRNGALSEGRIGSPDPNHLSGGLLNGKAVSLAKPAYPAAAKAVRAGGTVSVQALIDEAGNMYSATAISGHPLLRRASEIAACGSKFSPTVLSGQPVKVSGVITYNFVP